MKILSKLFFVSALSAAILAFASCASEPKAAETHDDVTVDWKDKGIGQVENPTWMLQLSWGNDRPFKDAFGIEYNRVCRIGEGKSALLEQAKSLSRLDVARKVAFELRSEITASAGESLSDEQLLTVNNALQAATVQISGLREEENHWKKVRKWDSKAKKYYDEFVSYTAFSISKESWEEAAKRYLLSLMEVSGLEDESQKALGATFSTLKDSAHRDDENAFAAVTEKARTQLERLGADEVAEFDNQAKLEGFLK